MESRTTGVGQILHEMVTLCPVVMLTTALLFDGAGLLTHGAGLYRIAYWLIAEGVIGGAIATVIGFIDLSDIPPGTPQREVGQWCQIANVFVIGLLALSWWLRYSVGPTHPGATAVEISFVATGLLLLTSWLGGKTEADVEPVALAKGHGHRKVRPGSATV